mmetsp:Transcript_18212/g.46237  ORF Transcript_18212/g.46237 Transcript_18212/m.46237 type:complete len:215 (-) Transcript_18212:1268-1912(-)
MEHVIFFEESTVWPSLVFEQRLASEGCTRMRGLPLTRMTVRLGSADSQSQSSVAMALLRTSRQAMPRTSARLGCRDFRRHPARSTVVSFATAACARLEMWDASAPRASSSATMSQFCPASACTSDFGTAPRSSSRAAMCFRPAMQLSSSAVFPSLFTAFTSIPMAMIFSATSTWDVRATWCRNDLPSRSRASTFTCSANCEVCSWPDRHSAICT